MKRATTKTLKRNLLKCFKHMKKEMKHETPNWNVHINVYDNYTVKSYLHAEGYHGEVEVFSFGNSIGIPDVILSEKIGIDIFSEDCIPEIIRHLQIIEEEAWQIF